MSETLTASERREKAREEEAKKQAAEQKKSDSIPMANFFGELIPEAENHELRLNEHEWSTRTLSTNGKTAKEQRDLYFAELDKVAIKEEKQAEKIVKQSREQRLEELLSQTKGELTATAENLGIATSPDLKTKEQIAHAILERENL